MSKSDGDVPEEEAYVPAIVLVVAGAFVYVFFVMAPLAGEFGSLNPILGLTSAVVGLYVVVVTAHTARKYGPTAGVRWLFSVGLHPDELPGKTYEAVEEPSRGTSSEEPGVSELRELGDSGTEFEQFVADLWSRQGYDTEVTPPSRDGGWDVEARREMPGQNSDERVLIEAKNYGDDTSFGRTDLDRYMGVASREDVDEFVVVTTGQPTRGAREHANDNSSVYLYGPEGLQDLIEEYW